MSVSDQELIRHILEETSFILDTIKDKNRDEVLHNGIIFRAIIRSLEIIGKATKKLNEDFKTLYPQIEWKKMARTRDILIHVYFEIDSDIIWNILTEKIPPLHQFLLQIT
ncbi:MAG: hypothetical protein K0Q79_2999 [Flavipsychrobacter sp.]|jgi:uncharacterized protein with HEPN domain|nr:hypothetical protein [Flavipsychrobacter sp.]